MWFWRRGCGSGGEGRAVSVWMGKVRGKGVGDGSYDVDLPSGSSRHGMQLL